MPETRLYEAALPAPDVITRLHALQARARIQTWTADDLVTLWDNKAAPAFCVTIESDGQIHGAALMRRVEREAELLSIVIDIDHRRCGLGRQLFGACQRQAAQYYVRHIYLEVARGNTIARSFYASMGFEAIGTRPGYYRDGTKQEPAVLYALHISPPESVAHCPAA